MVLSFYPAFKPLILNETKIHTLRVDEHKRWKPGMKIHFATGMRTKAYEQFGEGKCFSVQNVDLWFYNQTTLIIVDGRTLSDDEVKAFATRDGFSDLEGLRKWFEPQAKGKHVKLRLIHWTSFKY